MIVGVTRDPVFRFPAVLRGHGRCLRRDPEGRGRCDRFPLDPARQRRRMVEGLRGYPLLTGARGRERGDVKALVDVVLAGARLASACGRPARRARPQPRRGAAPGAVAVDSLVVTAG